MVTEANLAELILHWGQALTALSFCSISVGDLTHRQNVVAVSIVFATQSNVE